jgi:hypothetical protein
VVGMVVPTVYFGNYLVIRRKEALRFASFHFFCLAVSKNLDLISQNKLQKFI